MLEIAAYVYCADQFTKRGTELMTNMGADWRRKFRFRIPVRCPDVWGKDSVREALVEILGFLSEDDAMDERRARRQKPALCEPGHYVWPFSDLQPCEV